MKSFVASLLVLLLFGSLALAQDHTNVSYGPEDRQYLDIYIAPSDCPTPVYFNAHGNGGNINLPNSMTSSLTANGISIVSWESLTSVNTPAEVQTGWDDAELMFAWVKANADTYNFDTTNFIIGGSSRGSILSWKYGHRDNPNIRGLYMYNALPDGVWADSTWWYPPNEVKVSSPPIFFVYRQAPGVTNDSHDPNNGFIIMDTYDQLGIGDRDTLIHSIGTSGNDDRFQFALEFVLSVITDCEIVNSTAEEVAAPVYSAFPNPFRDQLQVAGLRGDESFALINLNGAVIMSGNRVEDMDLSGLNQGVYFLRIEAGDTNKVLRLVKR